MKYRLFFPLSRPSPPLGEIYMAEEGKKEIFREYYLLQFAEK